MDSGKISLGMALASSIAFYQNRHGGKRPARIFASTEALLELDLMHKIVVHAGHTGRRTFCGIPVFQFEGDGEPEYYLSDKEAS